jgi:hypothetical protein
MVEAVPSMEEAMVAMQGAISSVYQSTARGGVLLEMAARE